MTLRLPKGLADDRQPTDPAATCGDRGTAEERNGLYGEGHRGQCPDYPGPAGYPVAGASAPHVKRLTNATGTRRVWVSTGIPGYGPLQRLVRTNEVKTDEEASGPTG